MQFDSESPNLLFSRESDANKRMGHVCVCVCLCVYVIEASELSVEDRVARPICRSIERVGDVRCILFDRRVIGEII